MQQENVCDWENYDESKFYLFSANLFKYCLTDFCNILNLMWRNLSMWMFDRKFSNLN